MGRLLSAALATRSNWPPILHSRTQALKKQLVFLILTPVLVFNVQVKLQTQALRMRR